MLSFEKLLRRYQSYLTRCAATDYWEKVYYLLERSLESHQCILLDCGCNDGENTLKVARHIGATKVYGIEFDEEALNKARNMGIITYKADLNGRFTLDNESVDVVFSNQVIEHLTYSLNFVREIYRVLRPNGYAIMGTENLASWVNIFALMFGWQPFSSKLGLGNPLTFISEENQGDVQCNSTEADIWSGYGYGMHNKILAYRGFKEIFERSGFKVNKICGVGYYPFPGMVGRLLSNVDPLHAFYLILKARKPLPISDDVKRAWKKLPEKRLVGKSPSPTSVPTGDVKKLAIAILYLLENEKLRREFGKLSKEHARRYNWDDIATRELEIVTRIMRPGASVNALQLINY